MKGISQILSHTIYTSLAIATMIAILFAVSVLRTNIQDQYEYIQHSYSAELIKDQILELNEISKESGGKDVIAKLELPLRGDFLITLSDNTISIGDINRTVPGVEISGSSYLPAYLQLKKTGQTYTIELVS